MVAWRFLENEGRITKERKEIFGDSTFIQCVDGDDFTGVTLIKFFTLNI